ncbi:MAG: hypothetical protein FWG87_07330, partial [Defluviitaleaceae bacterium]|nr:hypothetical protein [Defluviitaleaceae bacterium]
MLKLSDISKREIVLYKLGKEQKDIQLFFEELNIVFYLEDDETFSVDTVRGKKVVPTSTITRDELVGKLVVMCSFT